MRCIIYAKLQLFYQLPQLGVTAVFHLRSTMLSERLSHLAVLSIESDHAKVVNLDKFVQHFARSHGNCHLKLILL